MERKWVNCVYVNNKNVHTKKKVKSECGLSSETAWVQIEAPSGIGWVTLPCYFVPYGGFLCNKNLKIVPLGRETEVE